MDFASSKALVAVVILFCGFDFIDYINLPTSLSDTVSYCSIKGLLYTAWLAQVSEHTKRAIPNTTKSFLILMMKCASKIMGTELEKAQNFLEISAEFFINDI